LLVSVGAAEGERIKGSWSRRLVGSRRVGRGGARGNFKSFVNKGGREKNGKSIVGSLSRARASASARAVFRSWRGEAQRWHGAAAVGAGGSAHEGRGGTGRLGGEIGSSRKIRKGDNAPACLFI
jgi:hypothetical protein